MCYNSFAAAPLTKRRTPSPAPGQLSSSDICWKCRRYSCHEKINKDCSNRQFNWLKLLRNSARTLSNDTVQHALCVSSAPPTTGSGGVPTDPRNPWNRGSFEKPDQVFPSLFRTNFILTPM